MSRFLATLFLILFVGCGDLTHTRLVKHDIVSATEHEPGKYTVQANSWRNGHVEIWTEPAGLHYIDNPDIVYDVFQDENMYADLLYSYNENGFLNHVTGTFHLRSPQDIKGN